MVPLLDARPEPAPPLPPHSRPKSWPRETQSSPQRIDAPPPAPLRLRLPLSRRCPWGRPTELQPTRALAAATCLLPTPPLQPRRGQKTGPLSPGPRRRRRLSAPTDAVTLLPGGGDPGFTGRGRSGAPPPTPLPAFSPRSPPPGPEPRAPRLGTGRGVGGQGCRSSPPLLLRPLERFVKLPIPPAARSSSSSFTTSSSSASSSPRAPPSPRLPRPPSFFPPHVRGSRRSAERGGRGEPGRSSILRAAALRGGG
ncbi:hypothetical protein R6Z07F_013093 [Ovis aries]